MLPCGAVFSVETRNAYGGTVGDLRALPHRVAWTSIATWTSCVFFVAGLFHPSTVPTCQALLVCMGLAQLAIAALVVYHAPFRSDATGWLDAASRVALACVTFCMAGALVRGEMLSTPAYHAALGFAIILIILSVVRVAHWMLCVAVDAKLKGDPAISLSVVWTHIVGAQNKMTRRFELIEEALLDLAGERPMNADMLESDNDSVELTSLDDEDNLDTSASLGDDNRTTTTSSSISLFTSDDPSATSGSSSRQPLIKDDEDAVSHPVMVESAPSYEDDTSETLTPSLRLSSSSGLSLCDL